MPIRDGFEVLAWARAQAAFRVLPIVVLSSSDHPADQARASQLGASHYFVKTPTFRDVVQYVHGLLEPKS